MDAHPSSFMVRTISMRRISIARATPAPPGRTETVGVGAPDQHGARAEAERFDDVAAAPDAAVQQHLDPLADGRDDFGQHAQRRRDAIELPPAVIRHDDRVGALSIARRASSPVCTPLTTMRPVQASRIQLRSSQQTIDCSSAAPTSAYGIGPVREGRCWGTSSGRRRAGKPTSHRGRARNWDDVRQHRRPACGDELSLPFRTSRSRRPATGVSIVTTSAEQPAVLRALNRARARRRGHRRDTAGTRPGRASRP